jgi:hypothetical protein
LGAELLRTHISIENQTRTLASASPTKYQSHEIVTAGRTKRVISAKLRRTASSGYHRVILRICSTASKSEEQPPITRLSRGRARPVAVQTQIHAAEYNLLPTIF